MTDEQANDAFHEQLVAQVGRRGSVQRARDPVNGPAIRTWCDAMSEANPYYTDEAAAAAGPHGGLVAPPATINMWTMPGLVMGGQPQRATDEPQAGVYTMLDDAGFVGVVATNSDQVYRRYLRPGDHLSQQTTLVDVSPQKQTALGVGHFVTTEVEYADQDGDPVGSVSFRIFKFRPGTGRERRALDDAGPAADAPRPLRPRPRWNQDQAWHWEGLRERELRIQRFVDDGTLVHPPVTANPGTQSTDYDWIVASGRGSLYSYTVPRHPQVPAFDYPLIVGLVELEEGVRMVTNIVGATPEQLEIGMPLEVCWLDSHDDVTLHQFRPAAPGRRAGTLTHHEVAVGDRLPLCPIEITTRLVVSTALATRDHQDVHHDRDAAVAKGTSDIFMNILTSTGLAARWIGDWAGDGVVFEGLSLGLGVPNHPGDTMTMSGSVAGVDGDTVTVSFTGANSLGAHMTGSARIVLSGGHDGPDTHDGEVG